MLGAGHRFLRRAAWAAIGLLLLGAATPTRSGDAIEPDAEVQRDIAAVAAATSAAELEPPIAHLRRVSKDDAKLLMPQLVYFAMRATDVRAGMAPAVILRELGLTRQQQLDGLAPYLDTTDEALARELRQFLGNLDDASAGHRPDFRHYEPLLRANAADPPSVLVVYLLETEPASGFNVLADACIGDSARRATLRAKADGGAAGLDTLAGDDLWWVRLYVAERLRQEPGLRTPELLRRLQADPNPLVRQALAAK